MTVSLGLNEPAVEETPAVDDLVTDEPSFDDVTPEVIDATALLERIAYVEAENAELRRLAVDATNQTKELLALSSSPAPDLLGELEELGAELRDLQIEEFRLEVAAFRKDVARRRRRRWWKR